MANGDGTCEGSEHARMEAFGVATFRDKEGSRRRMRQPRPHLHRAGGGATTATVDDASGLVD